MRDDEPKELIRRWRDIKKLNGKTKKSLEEAIQTATGDGYSPHNMGGSSSFSQKCKQIYDTILREKPLPEYPSDEIPKPSLTLFQKNVCIPGDPKKEEKEHRLPLLQEYFDEYSAWINDLNKKTNITMLTFTGIPGEYDSWVNKFFNPENIGDKGDWVVYTDQR